MDIMVDALHNYFVEVVTILGMVVWSIRLEGKVKQQQDISRRQYEELRALDIKLRGFDSKILLKLSEIAERLSYIEGNLKGSNKDHY